MLHSALIVSKQQLELDSRFFWAATLTKSDYSSESVIILHDSDDDENDLLLELAKLYTQDKNRKFIYISARISPLLAAYFFGVNGIVIDDDFPLTDADLLLSIISDYRDSDLRIKAPTEQFGSLQLALNRILSGDLDENELHEILTNPDWLQQIKGSMNTVSSSLTLIDNSNRALSTFVDRSREKLFAYKDELAKTKQSLNDALAAVSKASSAPARVGGNPINAFGFFPTMSIPIGVPHVLYVKELSPCVFLTSFLYTYSRYLMQKCGIPTRLLVAERSAKLDSYTRYNKDVFYNLDKQSMTHRVGNDVTCFLTMCPMSDVMQYFFNVDCKLFIIIDRLYQEKMLLNNAPKMKVLYASNSVSQFEERQIPKASTIAPFRRDANAGGFNIPIISGFSRQKNMVGMYYSACRSLYDKLDTYIGLEVN